MQTVGTFDGHAAATSRTEIMQTVGTFDDHAGAASGFNTVAAEILAGNHQWYERGAGRIHDAADVKHTVILERPRWLAAD